MSFDLNSFLKSLGHDVHGDSKLIIKYEPMKCVVDSLKYVSSGDALDIGAFRGRHSLLLAEKGFNVTAIDQEAGGLIYLGLSADSMGLKVKCMRGDIKNYEWERKFDMILFTGVFQYMEKEDGLGVIENMKFHTKKGGVNVISAFQKNPDARYTESVVSLFDEGELAGLYSGNDWDIKETYDFNYKLKEGRIINLCEIVAQNRC